MASSLVRIRKVKGKEFFRAPRCRCGDPFVFLGELADGRKLYYWCLVCDVAAKERR